MKAKLKARSRRGRSSRSYGGTLHEYIAGLQGPSKKLPCKLFYDEEGNRLFDRICELEEYYPTRTEFAILQENAAEIASLAGPGAALVELGSGTGAKGRMLLNHLQEPALYVPVEIAREQLSRSCEEIQADFPELRILSVCTDYTQDLRLPTFSPDVRRALLFFPGSTLGNFEPIEAVGFLLMLAQLGGEGAALLIGIDLKKEKSRLEAAYNDSGGVTAAFNLNILARANREFGADFQLDRFRHRAFYDEVPGRVVMQIESRCDQRVRLGPELIPFALEEVITTEFSYKYSLGEFQALARMAGFSPAKVWTDPEKLFSIHYLTVG